MTDRQHYRFPEGRIDLTVTSRGGALGEERYELTSPQDSGRTIFSGSNFSEFDVAERDGKLVIQLCKGSIDHAEPWAIGPDNNLKLVRLNIDWNCKDKRHEA